MPKEPLPRKPEGIPGGDRCFRHVPLLTYLVYFSSKGLYMVSFVYMPKSPHGTLISLSLVLN